MWSIDICVYLITDDPHESYLHHIRYSFTEFISGLTIVTCTAPAFIYASYKISLDTTILIWKKVLKQATIALKLNVRSASASLSVGTESSKQSVAVQNAAIAGTIIK